MQRNLKNDGTRCERCGGSFAVGNSGVCANCATPEPRAYGWPRGTWLAQRLIELRLNGWLTSSGGDA